MIFLISYRSGVQDCIFPWKCTEGAHLHTRGISKRLGRVLGFRVISRDVAQLVARTAGGREVASSSLVIPTMK